MSEDMCPICRSSRYLNPDMQFLVNPECYHKMCESCVDRIFSVGPAPCPYKGCGKTLRKGRFKKQVFENLGVEKEVDIRQRVFKVYNRREESFESPEAYNDYLERIETLVFDIMAGGQLKKAALEEISAYEKANKKEILENALKMREEDALSEQLKQHEVERQRNLRLLAIELQHNEQQVRLNKEQELVETLASNTGRKTRKIMQDIEQRAQEQLQELRSAYEVEIRKPQYQKMVLNSAPKKEAGPSTPFTPFAGDRQQLSWVEQDNYFDPTMERSMDPATKAGGFSPALAQHEAITLAFMGLSVDVQTEKSEAKGEPVKVETA